MSGRRVRCRSVAKLSYHAAAAAWADAGFQVCVSWWPIKVGSRDVLRTVARRDNLCLGTRAWCKTNDEPTGSRVYAAAAGTPPSWSVECRWLTRTNWHIHYSFRRPPSAKLAVSAWASISRGYSSQSPEYIFLRSSNHYQRLQQFSCRKTCKNLQVSTKRWINAIRSEYVLFSVY